MRAIQIFAAGVLALLSGCDVKENEKPADRVNAGAQTAQAPAEGKAEDGRISIKGPGFDLKVNVPEGVGSSGNSENELLYPGSKLSGMHIEAEGATGNANARGGIELRFTSSDPLEKVAAWYGDPARQDRFAVESAAREGGALVIRGSQKGNGDAFMLRLVPAGGGGTLGRMSLTGRG